ncbi:MAG: thrombospondin type 3 repeat-containing protein [Pseudomonadales bacterium]|nr:thrombospondin type 3 repeat-containing protein [Pseudomonadales bacterium]
MVTCSEPGALSLMEGTTYVTTMVVSDPENDDISFELAGADGGAFTLTEGESASVGQLRPEIYFTAAPDFENPSDSNADNVYEVTLSAADGSSSTSIDLTITVTDAFEGRVVDGPVAGAEVFVDINCNKEADADEPAGVTDDDGFFQIAPFTPLPECEAKLIAQGGTDTHTGQELPNLALVSDVPEDLTDTVAVTPLTTVLASAETEEEKQMVLDAFGLEGTPEEAITTDSWAEAEEGDEAALAVQRANEQISAVMQTAATVAESADTADADVDQSLLIAETVAEQLVELVEENAEADLTDAETLTEVMAETLAEVLPEEDWDDEVVAAVAASVATVNTVLGDEDLDPTSDAAAEIAEAVQDELQESVEAVASGEQSVEEFSEETGLEELFDEIVVLDAPDNDQDGLADALDPDDDNDGVLDDADAYPTISVTGETDTDADGAPDACDSDCIATGMTADTDDDGDGVLDDADAFRTISVTGETDTDADGAPDACDTECLAAGMTADTDDDGDGVADASDVFPLDSTETVDTDSDGTGNNADTDDDGDGIEDSVDSNPMVARDSTSYTLPENVTVIETEE